MLKRFFFRVFFETELLEQHLFVQEQFALAVTEDERKYFEGKASVIEELLNKYGVKNETAHSQDDRGS